MMVSDCTHCGYKDSEVKPGGAVSAQGIRITLAVLSPHDLQRDVLKVYVMDILSTRSLWEIVLF